MRPHMHRHIEITRLRAARSHLPLTCQGDALSALNAGRDADHYILILFDAPIAAACRAFLGKSCAAAATGRARNHLRECPEKASCGALHLSGSAAGRAFLFLRTRFPAPTAAVIARGGFIERDGPLHTAHHFFKADFHIDLNVTSSLHMRAATSRATEYFREKILPFCTVCLLSARTGKSAEIKPAEIKTGALRSARRATLECLPETVILRALLLVGKHLIGLVDFVVRRIFADAQNVIVVCHTVFTLY